MQLSPRQTEFLEAHAAAAMVTVAADGRPKVARVGIGLVDGRLWSSATEDRVRTGRLRRDPRCTLYVPDPGFAWLALETTVAVLDGPEVPALSLRFFRRLQGAPTGPLSWFGAELDEDAFLARMVEERRVLYEFTVEHAYGTG